MWTETKCVKIRGPTCSSKIEYVCPCFSAVDSSAAMANEIAAGALLQLV